MRPQDLLITVPHASTHIPADIRGRIAHNDYTLNHEPDLFTDILYAVPGVDTVLANVSRVVVDVNRAPDEVYMEGPDRNKGVVMLALSTTESTFTTDPTLEVMQEWINRYHTPFHEEVDRIIGAEKKRFLIDCHSMWSQAPLSHQDRGKKRPDICIGNRLYTTCDAETTLFLKRFWEERGYSVEINDPYIGRYVTGIHCSVKGMPGVQIELNRELYMDEVRLAPNEEAIVRINGSFREFIDAFCRWDEEREKRSSVHMCDLGRGYAALSRRAF